MDNFITQIWTYLAEAGSIVGDASTILEPAVWIIVGVLAFLALPFIVSTPIFRFIATFWEKWINPHRDDYIELFNIAKECYVDGEITADEMYNFQGSLVEKYQKITGKPAPGPITMAIIRYIASQIMRLAADFQKNTEAMTNAVAAAPNPDPAIADKLANNATTEDDYLRMQAVIDKSTAAQSILGAVGLWLLKQAITILINIILPSLQKRIEEVRVDMARAEVAPKTE